jgi:hypothetical protein
MSRLYGRDVWFVGAPDVSAVSTIQGSTLALAYVDEATNLPEPFWKMLESRLRVPGAKLLATCNPEGPAHWLKKDYLEKPDLDLVHWNFTLDDNPSLDEKYKQQLKASYSGMWYNRYILGEWALAHGAIFDNYDHNNEFNKEFPAPNYYVLGIDYGTTNATAAVLCAISPRSWPQIRVEEEYYYDSAKRGRSKTDEELVRDIQGFIAHRNVSAIYVDPAGNVYATDNGVSGTPISRVQKWNAGATSGITVAGGHNSGWDILSYPTGVGFDNNGFMYVFDGVYNPRVQKYKLTNGIVDNMFTPTQPGLYTSVASFKDGCVASSNERVIRAIPSKPGIYPTHEGGRGNLCNGGLDTFFVSPWDDITKYTWRIPGTCSLVANFNDSIVISVPAGFTYGRLGIRGTNICGTGIPDTLVLLGRPVRPQKVTGPRHVFANQQGIIYSVDDINSLHNWVVPADAVIQSGQGSASISVNWGSSAGTLSVNSYNDCGTSQNNEITVLLKSSSVQGDKLQSNSLRSADVTVAPNPAVNIATIKFSSVQQVKYILELRDITGKILMLKEFVSNKGSNIIDLDVSKYATGTYFICLKDANGTRSFKLNKN